MDFERKSFEKNMLFLGEIHYFVLQDNEFKSQVKNKYSDLQKRE